MKNIDNLHTIGKSSKKHSTRGKSFGYQILGFGSGGAAVSPFVVATGGTITTCGDYKIHAFTGDGTFTVTGAGTCAGSETVDYSVAAGGGGGGGCFGGGGGAGGFRFSNGYCLPGPTTHPNASPVALPVSVQDYPITVGGGGAGGPTPSITPGEASVFSSITSAGGGVGAVFCGAGTAGGSGGGGASSGGGGAGNTPPTSPLPPQGEAGGGGAATPTYRTGGAGGGAGGVGADGGSNGGLGGVGSYISPSFAVSCAGTSGPVGSTRYFSGGGGGGGFYPGHNGGAGSPGGGGGKGGGGTADPSVAGGDNTGGGGGGGAGSPAPGPLPAAGGSGIVLIRYKFQ